MIVYSSFSKQAESRQKLVCVAEKIVMQFVEEEVFLGTYVEI